MTPVSYAIELNVGIGFVQRGGEMGSILSLYMSKTSMASARTANQIPSQEWSKVQRACSYGRDMAR